MADVSGKPPAADDRSRLLSALRSGRLRQPAAAIPLVDRSGPLPASLGQQRLWFIDQVASDRAAYVISDCVLLRGDLDVAALRESLDVVYVRHETLRTVFEVVDGTPMQRVLSPDVPVELLEVLDAGARDAHDLVTEWLRKPFDLADGPVFRALVVHTGPGEALFCLAVHHIATDGWSFGILMDDVAAAYGELTSGGQPDRGPAALGYADFASWQRDSLTGPALTSQLDYWVKTLDGAPGELELPKDHPRPAVQSYQGDIHQVVVPADVAATLKAFGTKKNLTLYVLLYTTFAAVLRRWTGQADIVVGTSIAGRSRVELESIFGFFVNNVVLRLDLSADPTWQEALAAAHEVVLGAFEHQDVPFEAVVDKLAPGRELSHNPLYQVEFVLQNFTPSRLRLPGMDNTPVEVMSHTSKFDLSMSWVELDSGELLGLLEYDSALFDRSTIERLGAHYVRMVSAVVDQADVPISRLPLLSEEEHARTVRRATGKSVEVPAECVHELIEQQAAKTPDAVAVRFEGTSLTYRELDRQANRVAHRLVRLGVGADDRVCVVMRRSLELMITSLAVLKAGAAYVPVDPDYPDERKLLMVRKSAARVVLTTVDSRSDVPPGDHEVLTVDATDDLPCPQEAPAVASNQDSLAYVIFTSGSTGEPKGAMVSHRALVNRLAWMGRALGVTSGDRVLQKTSYGFDVSVWELFLPLTLGGTVVVAAPGAHRDPAALAKVMVAENVSIVHFVPPMLAVFIDQPGLPAFPALRAVICSGEALPWSLTRAAQERLSVQCHNLYGPAETAIDVTWRAPSDTHEQCPVEPLGFAIDNVRVLVLNEGMTPQPVGVAGELFIGGVGVGRGYVNAPGLTAERFLPDPFGPPGSVLYRTGDRARWLPDGDIEFLGRLDQQVKVRGFRVELEEIESALRTHPSVSDAAVVASTDGESLLGYVVPTARVSVDAEQGAVVGEWTDVFDTTYDASEGDGGTDYAGWRSSYTRKDYTHEEMDEWVRSAVAGIGELNPRHLLEIGCGTGLLLDPLLPSLSRYVGTDIAATVVDRLNRRYGGDDRVEIRRAAADETDTEGAFDTVVLNSVVQYFPDAAYLTDVLDNAVRALVPGGAVYIGDVRGLPLYPAFRLSVMAEEATGPMAVEDILRKLAADTMDERELVVDPGFFADFARRHGLVADIRFKTGVRPTEMNMFRYDVRLRPKTGQVVDLTTVDTRPYAPGDLPGLLDRIAADATAVRITDVPHPQHAVMAAVLDELRSAAPTTRIDLGPVRAAREDADLVPGSVVRLARERGLSCYCVPSAVREGTYEVLLTPRPVDGVTGYPGDLAGPLTNEPRLAVQHRMLVAELREYLRGHLPEFMVPGRVIVLPELPLTPNGKTDRARLRGQAPKVRRGSEPPRGATEQRLATIVCDLLGHAEIGRDDDFFAMGGHSIVALQLVNKARAQGIVLTASAVFANPTVAAMAAVSVPADAGETGQPETGRPAETGRTDFWQQWDPRPWRADIPSGEPFPVSPMQHEMLCAALEKHEPGLHNALAYLVIAGQSFDPAAFTNAWHHVLKRHAIFRTSFSWHGLPRPVLTPRVVEKPPVTVIDVTDRPPAEREARVQAAVESARKHIYVLDVAPLWHITVLRTDDDEFHVILGTTYLLQDGWSMENVQRDLFTAYDIYRQGGEPEMRPAPEFRDYAEWVARRDFTADAEYWSKRMRRFGGRNKIVETIGRPRVLEPTDMPYEQERISVSAELIAPLPRLAAARGFTTFTLLQAAWVLAVSIATQRDDVTIGVVTSGRPEHFPRMPEMVGSINNILPAVMDIPPDMTVTEWLRTVQTDLVEMREHQYVALAQVREWAGLPWRHQLYDIHVVFENFPQTSDNVQRLQEWEPRLGLTQTENPIRATMWLLESEGLIVDLGYYTRYFDVATIRRLLELYRDVVLALADRPDEPVAEIRRPFMNVFTRAQAVEGNHV